MEKNINKNRQRYAYVSETPGFQFSATVSKLNRYPNTLSQKPQSRTPEGRSYDAKSAGLAAARTCYGTFFIRNGHNHTVVLTFHWLFRQVNAGFMLYLDNVSTAVGDIPCATKFLQLSQHTNHKDSAQILPVFL